MGPFVERLAANQPGGWREPGPASLHPGPGGSSSSIKKRDDPSSCWRRPIIQFPRGAAMI